MRNWINLIEQVNHTFPTVTLPEVFHVGSIDVAHKRKDSHEGAGMSVSLHPNAWRQIGRGFVDGSLWSLTKSDATFLNYHDMTDEHRFMVVSWGMQNGLIEPHQTFEVSYFDDEADRRISFYVDSLEDAEKEVAEFEDMDERVEPVTDGYIMTSKLQAKCNLSGSHYVNCLDYLSIAYTEDVLRLDGVWWEDEFDPHGLSAPRGVIFPSKLPYFTVTAVSEDAAPDHGDY